MTQPPLRVLQVLEAIEGGTARHLVDVVRHTPGVEHIVVVPEQRVGGQTDRGAVPAMVAAGASIQLLDMRRDPVRPANALAVGRLIRLIRRTRPDVVHTHSSIGGLVGRLAAAACRVPRLYTPHAVTDVQAGIAVERVLGRITDVLIAVSPSERARVLDLGLVRPDRVRVVVNGIELDPPQPAAQPPDLRDRFGIPPASPLVGSISRLVPQKAPEHLAAAWAEAARASPEAHFVLIGAGPLQEQFDAAIDRLDVRGRVHQLEQLPEAWSVLDQLTVFSLASRFEGAPYALLEAARAGAAIAATDVVGTRDFVEDGVTGVLAPVDDPAALGRRIGELLSDAQWRRNVVEAARKRLAREFDVNMMGERLAAIYADASGRRSPLGRSSA